MHFADIMQTYIPLKARAFEYLQAAAYNRMAFEYQHLLALKRQQRRCRQPTCSGADDDGIQFGVDIATRKRAFVAYVSCSFHCCFPYWVANLLRLARLCRGTKQPRAGQRSAAIDG